jgi:hypothetical protein
MKRHVIVAAAVLCVVALAGVAVSQEKGQLVSGPQVGKDVPGPFHPLNVNGRSAGKKNCLYCEYGNAPVVMVFARESSPAVTNLVKKIDQCTVKHAKEELNSCVIFLNDAEELPKQLKALVEKEGIKTTVLAVDNRQGPEDYKIAKDADVTVLVYTDRNVRANRAFRRGELNEQQVEQVLTDVRKMLTK